MKSVLERANSHGDVRRRSRGNSRRRVGEDAELGPRADFAVSSLTAERRRSSSICKANRSWCSSTTRDAAGREVLAYAKTLSDQHADRLAIFGDGGDAGRGLVRKQHEEMRLAFPIHDGNGLRLTFAWAETPRFLLVDHAGVVRLTQTGWGYHMPYEIADLMQRFPKK